MEREAKTASRGKEWGGRILQGARGREEGGKDQHMGRKEQGRAIELVGCGKEGRGTDIIGDQQDEEQRDRKTSWGREGVNQHLLIPGDALCAYAGREMLRCSSGSRFPVFEGLSHGTQETWGL